MAGCACARWLQLSGAGQGAFDNARSFLLGPVFWQWLAALVVAVQGALKRCAYQRGQLPLPQRLLRPSAPLPVRSFTPLAARPRVPSQAIQANDILN